MCPLVASSVMIPFIPLFAQNREILDAESVLLKELCWNLAETPNLQEKAHTDMWRLHTELPGFGPLSPIPLLSHSPSC